MIFSFPIMLVVRFVFGLGEAAFPAGSWKTIATYFPSRERATATAIQASVNALGPALATVAAATIIAAFGWRAVFISLGIPGLLIAAAIYFYFRNDPKDHPRMTQFELDEVAADPGPAAVPGKKVTMSELMKMPILWQMVLIWFCYDITYWGFVSWLPSYLMKARNISLQALGFYGSLPFFIGTVGLVLGGIFSDKLKARGLHRKWLFIPTAAVAAVFLYFTFMAETIDGCLAAQCVASFFLFLAFGAFWGILVDSIPTEIMGFGSATVNFGGQVAGIVAGWAVGKLVDVRGGSYDWAFLFLISGVLAALIVALTIKDTMKKKSSVAA
jgi:sugar phosphate permease